MPPPGLSLKQRFVGLLDAVVKPRFGLFCRDAEDSANLLPCESEHTAVEHMVHIVWKI